VPSPGVAVQAARHGRTTGCRSLPAPV